MLIHISRCLQLVSTQNFRGRAKGVSSVIEADGKMLHDEISLRFHYRGYGEADEFVVTEMKYH